MVSDKENILGLPCMSSSLSEVLPDLSSNLPSWSKLPALWHQMMFAFYGHLNGYIQPEKLYFYSCLFFSVTDQT